MAGRYRSIEHTADLAIEVEADSVEELFRWAARGMFDLIRGEGPKPEGEPTTRHIAAEGPDLESRLVAWLGELLYVHVSEGLVLTEVASIELEGDRVAGRVALASPPPQGVERELKGVTYHDLRVERRDDSWRARIVFDV